MKYIHGVDTIVLRCNIKILERVGGGGKVLLKFICSS